MLQTNRLTHSFAIFILTCAFLLLCQKEALAAKNFTISLSPAVVVTMGDAAGTQLVYTITNTDTGGDASKSIRRMTFALPAGYTFGAGMTAPSGWTIKSQTATQIVFDTTSNTSPPKIATGASLAFTLILGIIPSGAQDSTDVLSSVTALYDDNKTKNYPNPAASAWIRKSLSINSFVVSPGTTTPGGGTFTLTLTVTNNSTSSWTIVSNTQPPNAVVSGITVNTTSNPSAIINAGQSGALIWTYTVGGNDCTKANPPTGTVYFTITGVKDTTSAATSKTGTYQSTPTVNVGCFTGSIALSPACVSSGVDVTVTMTLTNGYGYDITGAAATLTPNGTATKTYKSGPVYSPSTTVAKNGGTLTATWVYTISGVSGATYFFSGTASGTLQTTPSKSVSANVIPSSTGNIVSPPAITASPSPTVDKNNLVGITWQFTNSLCNPIKQVDITNQGGWTFLDCSAITPYDWTASFPNPTVTFAAGTNINVGGSGSFMIFFSAIPAVQGNYTFPVTLTDTTGVATTVNSTVSIGPDSADNIQPARLWKEEVR